MADGWIFPSIDSDRDFAQKVKPQIHRAGLTFIAEGFWFKANKTSPVRETDYSTNNWATTLKQEEASGQNLLHVNSVKGFGRYMPITIARGTGNEETNYITAIDVTNKVLTLQSNLTNTQSSGASVDMDQIVVTESNGITTIDLVICGQNANSAIAGCDFQFAYLYVDEGIGWENVEKAEAQIRVPYAVGASILGGYFAKNLFWTKGTHLIIVNSGESASAIDPNYVIRFLFIGGGDKTEKHVAVQFGSWRA